MSQNQTENSWRKWAYRVFATLFVIGTIASVVTIWANVRIQESDAWRDTVAPLARDEDVQAFIVDQAMVAINEQLATDSDAGRLSLAVSQMTPLIRSIITDFVDSEAFAMLWADSNYYAHEALLNAARGEETDLVYVADDTLIVNLQPLIDEVNAQLNAAIPGNTYSIQLAREYSTVEVVHTDALTSIVNIFKLVDRLSVILPVLSLVSLAIALAVSSRRMAALGRAMIALAVSSCVLLIALNLGGDWLVGTQPEANQAMLAAILKISLVDLMRAIRVVAAIGVATGLLAFLLQSRYGSMSRFGQFLRQNRVVLTASAIIAAMLYLIVVEYPAPGLAVSSLIVIIAGGVAFVAWRRRPDQRPIDVAS